MIIAAGTESVTECFTVHDRGRKPVESSHAEAAGVTDPFPGAKIARTADRKIIFPWPKLEARYRRRSRLKAGRLDRSNVTNRSGRNQRRSCRRPRATVRADISLRPVQAAKESRLPRAHRKAADQQAAPGAAVRRPI